jgi:CRP-like cAMP-binding protein
MEGVACLYERLKDGNRQIYAFQYPGDFCDLHQHVLPNSNNEVAVAALTGCSIGIIEHRDLEQVIAQYPSLGLALWRATMLEASIFRKRLLNVGRQPALQRVAHLLCEQLARREAVGINSATIPLTQMDLADAAGLSIVHVNRTFQELRRLDILSKEGRAIKVVDRERLVCLAGFDGHYLNMPQLLSHWQVKIEPDSMLAERSPAMSTPSRPSVALLSRPAALGPAFRHGRSIIQNRADRVDGIVERTSGLHPALRRSQVNGPHSIR